MSCSGCPAGPTSPPTTPSMTPGSATSWSATRRGRPRRRGLRQGDGQGRRVAGHKRAGSDEPGHADLRRDDGFGSRRVSHRPSADRPARYRRVSGGRHDRHHHADRQAQLHDPAPAGNPPVDPRGLPHRPHGTPGAGRGRYSAGPEPGRHSVRAGDRCPPARLPAHDRGQPEADPTCRQGVGQLPSPGHLRRGWRGERGRLSRADRARPVRPAARDLHGDGARSLPGAPRPMARDARDARNPHGQLRHGRGRPDRRHRRPLR